MIWQIFSILTFVKILFIPYPRSTDFEVHRNWLAITHNLTLDKWYYENTSEWTLDYPPFFAWFEYVLSYAAKWFDPKMLEIRSLEYVSWETVLFQKLSVIFMDFVFFYGAWRCSNLVTYGKLLSLVLLVSNPGLLLVDHIHFQYNGFLYGLLLISISHIIMSEHIQAAFWFAVLLNFKHIFLYIAPVYIVYLFRAYCFTVPTTDGVHTAWHSFSITNLIKLGATVVAVFAASLGPFYKHLPQMFSRLFPFKRGLCHAFWAPNFWAYYNFVDKTLVSIRSIPIPTVQHFNISEVPKIGIAVEKSEAVMTGGLVQEYNHTVLPNIKPWFTFLLTILSMLPALVKMWNLCVDRRVRPINFVRCIVVCASCSFMFGWHVHEKAILMVLIPMSFLAMVGQDDGQLFLLLSVSGTYSLLPLLYPANLLSIKLFLLLTHCAIIFGNIPHLYGKGGKRGFLRLPMLGVIESIYIYGFILLFLYDNVVHVALKWDKVMPFMPLMLTSVYCSVGIIYFWFAYYYYFLTFNLSTFNVSEVSDKDRKRK